MPISIDPQPGENEVECARCGAHIHYQLTRCPECGINLYEPEAEPDETIRDGAVVSNSPLAEIFSEMRDFFQRLFRKPYAAEEVFGDSLNQAMRYNDLLLKVSGDEAVVERLIEFERQQSPDGTRLQWLERAIELWERDNRVKD